MAKTKIIVVAGPTASGKTSLGIEIAKAINGEIICADSMQVYKGMPIATAAPTKQEQSLIKHHLCSFLPPEEKFSAAQFVSLANKCISDISSRGKTPVIVGGTGLFIDSLVDGRQFVPLPTDYKLREKLMAKSEEELYNELTKTDEKAAKAIHKNNKIRVVRALELCYATGSTKSEQDAKSLPADTPYDVLYFVLRFNDRNILYNRINDRVDLMVQNGLINEAEKALAVCGKTSSQAIGHKELAPYFKGDVTLDDALENLKKETRHYAKRQITWFSRHSGAEFITVDSNPIGNIYADTIKKAEDFLNG